MANADNPSGASPVGCVLRQNWYAKGTAAALYKGDFASLPAAGKLAKTTAGNTEIVGVVAGYAAAADTEVLVMDDPDQQYYIQADATLTNTDIGLNIDLLATTGNATYLKSQMEVDATTEQTTTAQLRILDKHPDDSWTANVRVRVMVNEHAIAKKTTGI